MVYKVKKVYVCLLICVLLIIILTQIFNYKNKAQSEDLNDVYIQSIDFLNDFYNKNADDTYSQLVEKNTCDVHYKTKNDWSLTIFNDIGEQTLDKILKPANSSDVSNIIDSDYPQKTYLVEFSLVVNHLGKKEKRTGEIEYVKTDNGFKVYKFSIDTLDGSGGRWVLY